MNIFNDFDEDAILAIGINYIEYDVDFKKNRIKKVSDNCFCDNCNSNFELKDKISIAITPKGNKLLCFDCAIKLIKLDPKIKVIEE